ncbi:MAG: hypothetical protein J6Y71_11015 [Ruminococcus sp.]|nr:hypothetical protein [Ruminococcus sp.]
MKIKFCSILFALLLAFGLTPLNISAKESPALEYNPFLTNTIDPISNKSDTATQGMEFVVDNVSAELVNDDEVRVPVRLTHNAGFIAGIIALEWDNTALELRDIVYSESAHTNEPVSIKNDGKIKIFLGNCSSNEDFMETGDFFTLVFVITGSATAGRYDIKLSNPDMVNADIADVSTSIINGSIQLTDGTAVNSTVSEVSTTTSTSQTTASVSSGEQGSATTETSIVPSDKELGDIMADGKIDAKDASFILVAYSNASTGMGDGLTEDQRAAGDVNSDRKIDAKDASAILAYYSLVSTSSGDVPALIDFARTKQQ